MWSWFLIFLWVIRNYFGIYLFSVLLLPSVKVKLRLWCRLNWAATRIWWHKVDFSTCQEMLMKSTILWLQQFYWFQILERANDKALLEKKHFFLKCQIKRQRKKIITVVIYCHVLPLLIQIQMGPATLQIKQQYLINKLISMHPKCVYVPSY